jgi:hypothetical protein
MTLIIYRVQNVSFVFVFSLMVFEYVDRIYYVSSFNHSIGYRHETGCTSRPYCETQGVEEHANRKPAENVWIALRRNIVSFWTCLALSVPVSWFSQVQKSILWTFVDPSLVANDPAINDLLMTVILNLSIKMELANFWLENKTSWSFEFWKNIKFLWK